MKKNFFKLMAGAAITLSTVNAQAAEPEKTEWSKIGEGTHKMTLISVYDAALYAPDGKYDADKPFKLKITYRINTTGKKLAKRTIDEMQNTNCKYSDMYDVWQQDMTKVFPADVEKGMQLTGVKQDDMTTFYSKSGKLGEIKGEKFQDCFFGVWLKESTSAPELREKLLGL